MINQVLIAGRLTDDPRIEEGRGEPSVEMQLEVERLTRFGAPAETCAVQVRAFGKGRIAAITKYLAKGRTVLIEGHLRSDGGTLVVVGQRIEFMERNLEAHAIEASSVAALAAACGARAVPAA